MTSRIRVARRRGVDHVWLASIENRNALSLQMLSELIEVAATSAADPGSRALIIDHDGPAFCAGIDVVERRSMVGGEPNHSTLFAELLRRLWHHPKPLITRVAGAVRGGGMGIVACADIAIATNDARFAFSEVRLGLVPALVGGLAVVKLGAAGLTPWLLTGEVFDGRAALRNGFVNQLAADDGAAELEAVIESITSAAPGAVAWTKSLLRGFAGSDIDRMLEEMTAVSAASFDSAEGHEGMRAFAEKRAPSWVEQ